MSFLSPPSVPPSIWEKDEKTEKGLHTNEHVFVLSCEAHA